MLRSKCTSSHAFACSSKVSKCLMCQVNFGTCNSNIIRFGMAWSHTGSGTSANTYEWSTPRHSQNRSYDACTTCKLRSLHALIHRHLTQQREHMTDPIAQRRGTAKVERHINLGSLPYMSLSEPARPVNTHHPDNI